MRIQFACLHQSSQLGEHRGARGHARARSPPARAPTACRPATSAGTDRRAVPRLSAGHLLPPCRGWRRPRRVLPHVPGPRRLRRRPPGSPPNRATNGCLAGLATPTTRSPRAIANCTAGTPTPPPAPLTNSVEPSGKSNRFIASYAVAAATGSAAAASGLSSVRTSRGERDDRQRMLGPTADHSRTTAENLVTDGEFGYPRPYCFDRPRHFATQHRRAAVTVRAFASRQSPGFTPAARTRTSKFVGTGLRDRDIEERLPVRSADLGEAVCAHRLPVCAAKSAPVRRRRPAPAGAPSPADR